MERLRSRDESNGTSRGIWGFRTRPGDDPCARVDVFELERHDSGWTLQLFGYGCDDQYVQHALVARASLAWTDGAAFWAGFDTLRRLGVESEALLALLRQRRDPVVDRLLAELRATEP